MNRRNLIIAVLIVIMAIVGLTSAKTVWSIADPSNPANAGLISDAQSQGYWNFEYDDAAPYTTAGLYCCWWERWYKWQKFSQWKGETTMNLATSEADSEDTSASAVETKSYCPSCCATCDDESPADLKARSDAIMAKKPWLTEGKAQEQPSAAPTVAAVTPVTTTEPQMVMTFSDAV